MSSPPFRLVARQYSANFWKNEGWEGRSEAETKKRIIMTDTERILEIIKDKGLSNVQFCATAKIGTATLSHIISGRSNPSLNILRSVVQGFPDLNPEWVYQGTGNMYRDLDLSMPSSPQSSPSSPFVDDNNKEETFPPFNFPSGSDAAVVGGQRAVARKNPSLSASSAASSLVPVAGRGGAPLTQATPVEGPLLAEVVKETMSHYERPRRHIIEVRVFFDDGTYESFGGAK